MKLFFLYGTNKPCPGLMIAIHRHIMDGSHSTGDIILYVYCPFFIIKGWIWCVMYSCHLMGNDVISANPVLFVTYNSMDKCLKKSLAIYELQSEWKKYGTQPFVDWGWKWILYGCKCMEINFIGFCLLWFWIYFSTYSDLSKSTENMSESRFLPERLVKKYYVSKKFVGNVQRYAWLISYWVSRKKGDSWPIGAE